MLSQSYRFCPHCGNTLQTEQLGGRPREACPACNFIHWGDFTLGVGGILWHQGKALLVQRALDPGKGMWTIPGGYVEQGEPLEEAIIREFREETGLETGTLSIVAVRDRPGEDGYAHDLYVIFLLKYLSGYPVADKNEVSGLGFFPLDEVRKMEVAPLTLSMLEATFNTASSTTPPGFQPVSGLKMIGRLSKLYRFRS